MERRIQIKYMTPEIRPLGDASSVIQDETKGGWPFFDPADQKFCLCPAYGLDE